MAVPILTQRSLYDRLGGSESISEIITVLYRRLWADPRIGGFWKGHSNDSKAKEISAVIEFVCQATGGPTTYWGRDMRTSHEGLVINERDWAVFSKIATEAMRECGVPEKERDEVLTFFDSFKEVLAVKEQPVFGSNIASRHQLRLSRREEEVLRLVATGKNNPEIADELSISLNTVTRHLTNIFSKTGTTNRVEAALYAARGGLV